MTKWVVHYIDGTTFSSEDGEPKDAPRQGVALIVQYVPEREVAWRHDTYCWEHDQWVSHDRFGCELYLDKTLTPVRLVGYCQPQEVFTAIYKAAKAGG